ncbi:MAG: lambda exonuclease family protein [Ferruginibacter sp.]
MEFLEELNGLLQDEAAGHINPALEAAWKSERLGKFTSSQIAKLLIKKTGKPDEFGTGAETYIYKKIGEILTQEANEVSSAAIKWGDEHEEDAVKMFERLHNKTVEYYGKKNPTFFPYETEGEEVHAGGSPDGFIADEQAVIETKCPYESGNHAEVLHLHKTGKFDLKKYDGEYYGQVQFNILLTKAKYAYFVSYDPRVIDYRYSIVAVKIERDEAYLTILEERVKKAIALVTTLLTQIGYYTKEEIQEAA